jgi:hypothetical protein
MKRIVLMLVALFAAFTLVACSTTTTTEAPILARADKDYYVTGNFNGWDTKADFKMVAIRVTDPRVAPIASALTGATALYIMEITLPTDAAGWGPEYKINGVLTTFDGNLTVKVIRTALGDSDSRDWWAPSPESGAITNLSPATMFMPAYAQENVDNAGDHNSNPVALVAGTYYAVFAEFGTASRGLGLVLKPAA